MQTAAKSVFYFGIYLALVGLQLLFVPQLIFDLFQLGEVKDVWIRVVGILVLCIGYYYIQTGHKGVKEFYPFTVMARTFVFIAFVGLVGLKLVAPTLLIFGAVDLIGAIWTWYALRTK